MLNGRNTQYDSFAIHDIDRNGTPELLVLSTYGPEQADIFAWNGSSVTWIGMMGGDNFFQDIIYYPTQPYPVLFALTGGPAVNIDAYSIQQGWVDKSSVGYTQVDSNGMPYGIQMYHEDSTLYQLLYGTLIGGQDYSGRLNWFMRSGLQSESDWNSFLQSGT